MTDHRTTLVERLGRLHDDVLAKLEGLDEHDLRRPLTPTGTNLLGVVKHLASVTGEYFGLVFDRPWGEPLPWMDDDAELNDDMWARPDESSAWVADLYRRAWAHARATIQEVDLDTRGTVPWWPPERRHPTLHEVLVHMTVETARHAGHLDVVRELVDGEAGRHPADPSLPSDDEIDWPTYRAKVQAAADAARSPSA